MEKWRGWLRQLLGKEKELHRSLEADVESVISRKNILLMEKKGSIFSMELFCKAKEPFLKRCFENIIV